MKVAVEVSYEFILDAESEFDAERIADSAITFIVFHPETGQRINPSVESWETNDAS